MCTSHRYLLSCSRLRRLATDGHRSAGPDLPEPLITLGIIDTSFYLNTFARLADCGDIARLIVALNDEESMNAKVLCLFHMSRNVFMEKIIIIIRPTGLNNMWGLSNLQPCCWIQD